MKQNNFPFNHCVSFLQLVLFPLFNGEPAGAEPFLVFLIVRTHSSLKIIMYFTKLNHFTSCKHDETFY